MSAVQTSDVVQFYFAQFKKIHKNNKEIKESKNKQ